jgi:hypothetical protein
VIRKFNRFELKYLVPLKAAEEFKQALRAYLLPDEHGDSLGCYYLSSLYYDGPDLRFFWEKVEGISFRRKLRIRQYESSAPLTENTPVFVEIEQRVQPGHAKAARLAALRPGHRSVRRAPDAPDGPVPAQRSGCRRCRGDCRHAVAL